MTNRLKNPLIQVVILGVLICAGVTGGYTFASIIRAQASLGQIFFNDKNGLMARFQVTVVLPSKSDRELLKQAANAQGN